MSGNWLEWCLPEPEYHWATQSHTTAQHRNFCIYSWGAWGWGQLPVFMVNRLRSFLWEVHIFSSWLPVNFSLPFKGTPQHLMKVIAHIQVAILMVSSPFGLLWCGARSRGSFLCNIWLRKACGISPSVFFCLVPEKSPFTLWGIFLKLHAYSWAARFLGL